MRWTKAIVAMVLAGAVAACGRGDDAALEYEEAVPDVAGVQLALDGEADGTAEQPLQENPPLVETALNAVRGVNDYTRAFLTQAEAVMQNARPVIVDGVAKWTVSGRDGLQYRLLVRRTGEAQVYEFALEARAAGSEAEFSRLLAGKMAKGEVARRGIGFLRIDLDARKALVPTQPESGEVAVFFAHAGRAATLRAAFDDYKANPEKRPVDAGFIYNRLEREDGNAGAVRLAATGDAYVPEGQDPAMAQDEHLLMFVRWVRGFRGRLDAVLFGGDVPQGHWVRRIECWNSRADVGYIETRYNDGAEPGVELAGGRGNKLLACAPGLLADPRAEELPADETLTQDSAAAEELAAADAENTEAADAPAVPAAE